MHIFKTFLLSLALAPLASFANTSSVWLSDASGNVTELQLSDVPTVKYSGNEIVVTAGETTLRFEGEGVSFTFSDPAQGSVDQNTFPGKNIKVTLNADTVSLSGLIPGSTVAAYSVSGVKTAEATASPSGSASLSLLPGINIIVTPSRTFKILL